MNRDNEERCDIVITNSQVLLKFEMSAESEFSAPHAIIRTRHIAELNGTVTVYHNTYYIYCKRYRDFALDIFLQHFPCEPVWTWEES